LLLQLIISVRKERQNRKRQGNQKEEVPGQEDEQDKGGDASVSLQGRPKKQIKCFNCEGDHYVNNCPEFLALRKAKEEGKLTAATWEGSTFCTSQVNALGIEGFGPTKVLLNNQADISIMRPDLLRMLEVAEKTIRVNGIGGGAALAHVFLRMSGYPSIQEAIHLIQDGNIANMPLLTAEDVKRAFELYGELVGSVDGKMTKRKVNRVVYDDDLIMDERKQVLYSDIMHLDSHKFLVRVCEPSV
jgi:hypothetical protein